MVKPTVKQLEIRDAPELDMLVVAPAGCGKTEALALRVAGLLERRVVEAPRRVLVTTFSNRATDNIRGRLRHYCSESLIRDRVTVTNFHGLASRIYQAHASTIGMDPSLKLPDSDWIGDQFRSRNTPWGTRDSVTELFRGLKQRPLTDEQVAEGLDIVGSALARELEQQRVNEGRLTYDDLLRLAELILKGDDVARLYQQHFGAVIVDEFQDLTPQQLRVVNRIGYQRTTYAGDLAQGIYAFAGAKPNDVDASIRTECTKVVTLSESHRSSPAVLAAVNTLAGRTGGNNLTSANPTSWPGGGMAASIQFASSDAEAKWAVDVSKFVLNRAPHHRIGVLSNIGSRRRFADRAFAASGLPVHRWDDGVLDTDTARIMRKVLGAWSPGEFAGSADSVEYLRVVTGFDGIQDPNVRQGLTGAINWACDLLQAGESATSVRARIRIGDATTLLNVNGVHLLSAHVGKGQQFDWVIVLGLEQGSMPFFKAVTVEAIAEEARVLAVMMSRARHGLILTHATSVETLAGRQRPQESSIFVSDVVKAQGVLTHADAVSWIKNADWEALGQR